jgi:hypothetical protein
VRIEAVLGKLACVRRNPRGWTAKCPAHEDRSPSLSIRETSDRILIHDFGGCRVLDVCAALGIQMRDLYANPASRKRLGHYPAAVTRALEELGRRLTKREQVSEVTVIGCGDVTVDLALARGLALTVDGEICVIALPGEKC